MRIVDARYGPLRCAQGRLEAEPRHQHVGVLEYPAERDRPSSGRRGQLPERFQIGEILAPPGFALVPDQGGPAEKRHRPPMSRGDPPRFDAKLERRLADLRLEFRTELHQLRTELVRWMFGFWVTTLLSIAGLLIALRGH